MLNFLKGLARACAGAIIFSLPMLMTMEMWYIGFTIDRLRFALLLALLVPVLTGLSFYAGFEETFVWTESLGEGLAAFAVGFIVSAAVLWVIGVVTFSGPLDELIGKVALQAIPASIGASLARAQFGRKSPHNSRGEEQTGYWSEMFHMAAGAVFLALNVAPTEEMVLISYMMSDWHALMLMLVSVAVMHAFVYAVAFRGHDPIPKGESQSSMFFRFTVVGYAVALVISAYILWTIGRFEGLPPTHVVMTTVVLGFPAAIGAAAARLIL